MKKIIIILVILLSNVAYAEDKITDKELIHGLITSTLMVVDMQYSLDINDNPGARETNPVFTSENPSDKEYYQKTAMALGAVWLFTYLTSEDTSVPVLDSISVVEIFIIDRHIELGLKMRF